jgi:hypothetical protein
VLKAPGTLPEEADFLFTGVIESYCGHFLIFDSIWPTFRQSTHTKDSWPSYARFLHGSRQELPLWKEFCDGKMSVKMSGCGQVMPFLVAILCRE